jgi:hypothetical protein
LRDQQLRGVRDQHLAAADLQADIVVFGTCHGARLGQLPYRCTSCTSRCGPSAGPLLGWTAIPR